MQKKLIALAIAGLSGAAFAQSNVTIYGVMDASYDNVSATGATNLAGVAGPSTGSMPTRNRTTFNSSYIGFKGVESIGNGLAVAFQIETGLTENAAGNFNAQPSTLGTGTYAGWATRDTYVGLAGGFGTIAAGNLTGPTRALGAAMDVNAGATGIGANTALLGKLGGGSGAGYFDSRITNAIAYISPTVSGFSGVIGYMPNENRGTDVGQQGGSCFNPTTGAVVARAAGAACGAGTLPFNTTAQNTNIQADTSAWTMGLTYANGPIYAAAAYTTVKDHGANGTGSGFAPATNLAIPLTNAGLITGNATPIQKIDNSRLGFKYDFGMATVGLLWDRTKATIAAFNGLDAKQTVWYIPVTFNLGNGKLIAQYGKANKVTGSLTDTYQALGICAGQAGAVGLSDRSNCDYSAKHFEIGYEYNLSKRTTIKALWSQVTNSKDAGNDFLYGVGTQGGGQNNSAGYNSAGVAAGADAKGFSLGLRHSF